MILANITRARTDLLELFGILEYLNTRISRLENKARNKNGYDVTGRPVELENIMKKKGTKKGGKKGC